MFQKADRQATADEGEERRPSGLTLHGERIQPSGRRSADLGRLLGGGRPPDVRPSLPPVIVVSPSLENAIAFAAVVTDERCFHSICQRWQHEQ